MGRFGRFLNGVRNLYFIVMAIISSALGGYLARRLRTKWVGVSDQRSAAP
jgi:hypothetical protein